MVGYEDVLLSSKGMSKPNERECAPFGAIHLRSEAGYVSTHGNELRRRAVLTSPLRIEREGIEYTDILHRIFHLPLNGQNIQS